MWYFERLGKMVTYPSLPFPEWETLSTCANTEQCQPGGQSKETVRLSLCVQLFSGFLFYCVAGFLSRLMSSPRAVFVHEYLFMIFWGRWSLGLPTLSSW